MWLVHGRLLLFTLLFEILKVGSIETFFLHSVQHCLAVDLKGKLAAHSDVGDQQRRFFYVLDGDVVALAERKRLRRRKLNVGFLLFDVQLKVFSMRLDSLVLDKLHLEPLANALEGVSAPVKVLEFPRVELELREDELVRDI